MRTLKNLLLSTLYLTLQVALIRSGFCLIGSFRGKADRLTGILAIMLGNLAVLVESVNRRAELALWMAPKMVQGMWNFSVRRGLIKPMKNMEAIVLVLSVGILGVGSVERKDFIKPTYNNILKTLWS